MEKEEEEGKNGYLNELWANRSCPAPPHTAREGEFPSYLFCTFGKMHLILHP